MTIIPHLDQIEWSRHIHTPLTDAGLGERVADWLTGQIAYDRRTASWMQWTGQCWKPLGATWTSRDEIILPLVRAWPEREASAWLATNPASVVNARKKVDEASDNKAREKARSELEKVIHRATDERRQLGTRFEDHNATAARVEAIVRGRSIAEFDLPMPGKWPVQNGVISWSGDGTIALLPHDPEMHCTRLAPAEFHPDARTDDWDRVLKQLDRVDPDVRPWAQLFFGAAIFGQPAAAKSVGLIWGPPDAGKSTVLTAVLGAIGPWGGTIAAKSLNRSSSGGGPEPELDELRGKRLYHAPEAGRAFVNSSLIKTLSGGDEMRTRGMRQTGGTWTPEGTLIMVGNHPATLELEDQGLRRRLMPVRIDMALTPDEVDPSLMDRLKDDPANRNAILTWIVNGTSQWLARGGGRAAIPVPESSTIAMRDLEVDSDPLLSWLEDNTVITEDRRRWHTIGELHADFAAWSRTAGRKPMGQRRFGELLTERGHAQVQAKRHIDALSTKSVRLRSGLALNSWTISVTGQLMRRSWDISVLQRNEDVQSESEKPITEGGLPRIAIHDLANTPLAVLAKTGF